MFSFSSDAVILGKLIDVNFPMGGIQINLLLFPSTKGTFN